MNPKPQIGKKQLAFFLGLFWLLGMTAYFNASLGASIQKNSDSKQALLKEISLPGVEIRSSGSNFSVPPFKIDWSTYGKLNPDNFQFHIALNPQEKTIPSFFLKEDLFNIIQFFIQYYYTW